MEIEELLNKAEKSLKNADHMIYITFPLIKENRLLKKVLENIHDSALNIIEAILRYEYMFKRIQLPKDKEQGWETFKNKCCQKLNIKDEEIENLSTLFELMEKHKQSSFEFTRKDRIVIMSDNLKTSTIGGEQLKEYLKLLKILLEKTRNYTTKTININKLIP